MGSRCSDDILNHIDENGILLCRNACPLANASAPARISGQSLSSAEKVDDFPLQTHINRSGIKG
jgi:hypothetical protein